jgi:hypothetical protein
MGELVEEGFVKGENEEEFVKGEVEEEHQCEEQ